MGQSSSAPPAVDVTADDPWMTLPAWEAPAPDPLTNDAELNNVLATMKRMNIFRPFELAAHLNAAIAEGRHARLLDVVREFFDIYSGAAPLDVQTYINESVTTIRDVAGGGSDFQFVTVRENTLRVHPGDHFLYFVFISYVAHRRGVRVEFVGAPSRTMQICFMTDLELQAGEYGLLLVDLMRTRNRGFVHYPPADMQKRVDEVRKENEEVESLMEKRRAENEERQKKDAITGNPY